MKSFFSRIGRFFGSWGFLKFVLAVLALIVLLYLEEDWRGAHAWAVTKAKWEAKGESFDYTKFIPPPIPDEQNLATIPLFEMQLVKNPRGDSVLLPNLEKAMRNESPYADIPQLSNWMKGEPPDANKIQKTLADDYAKFFPNQKPPADSLALFDALFPFTADLRSAAVTRPQFRYNSDYTINPPDLRPLGPVIKAIPLSRILTTHAVLALDKKEPELALGDIKTSYILISGIVRDPSLVGGLVAMGASAVSLGAVYHGLAYHNWSDQQLLDLEKTLRPLNFLDTFQFDLRTEASMAVNDMEYFKTIPRSQFPPMVFDATFVEARLLPWPGGWWDNNARQLTDFHFQEAESVDSSQMLAYPVKAGEIKTEISRKADRAIAYAPWNVWFTEAAVAQTNVMIKFAEAQVWIGEARIACALERYRLAQGIYPPSLETLTPAYIDELPHDIMNGQPYRYQVRPDGTYLLYSVGWNQTDDGGQVAYKTGYDVATKQVDYEQGDWVWPTPNYNAPAK